MKKSVLLCSTLLASLLCACTEDSNDNNADAKTSDTGSISKVSSKQQVQIGTFIDAPIANIQYRTETRLGKTNDNGEFEYMKGETVTFYIGNLELPAVAAKQMITPLDMTKNKSIDDNRVVNIIRLLQTLDVDANPDNGIKIPSDAIQIASQVNFDLDVDAFAQQDAITNLISNANPQRIVEQLVDITVAKSHFADQLQARGIKVINLIEDASLSGLSLDYLPVNLENQNLFIVTNDKDYNCNFSGWGLKTISFYADGSYQTTQCDNSITNGSYRALNGYLELTSNNTVDYQYRLKYTYKNEAFESCSVDPILVENSCINNYRNFEFLTETAAKKFLTSKLYQFINNRSIYIKRTDNIDCQNNQLKVDSLTFSDTAVSYTACDGKIVDGSYSINENNIITLKLETGTQYLYLEPNDDGNFDSCKSADLSYTQNCVTDKNNAYLSLNDMLLAEG